MFSCSDCLETNEKKNYASSFTLQSLTSDEILGQGIDTAYNLRAVLMNLGRFRGPLLKLEFITIFAQNRNR